MKYYEMLCVLPGTMTEEEVKSGVDSISQTIAKFEASDVTVEDMGKSRLAYPIKHIRYGYFQLFRFNMEEKNIIKLEKEMRLLDKMLRIAISVCDPNTVVSYKLALDPTAPSAKPKAEKPGREERSKSKPTTQEEETTETSPKEEKVEASEEKPKEDKKEEVSSDAKAMDDKKEETKKPVEEKAKMSVEDIDKKLDEILQDDMDKV